MVGLNVCKKLSIGLAACSYDLGTIQDGKMWVQITPVGKFRAKDGRPSFIEGKRQKIDDWFIDATSAAAVIERFNKTQDNPVIDYEHQTLYKEQNGQPAPAAAWFIQLEWREGKGLFALIELTNKAQQAINDKEYRYFSPVFLYDEDNGTVEEIIMGAFTNYAAIDGMQPLAKLAANLFLTQQPQPEDTRMDEILKLILKALGLKEDATEEEILAAIAGLKDQANQPPTTEAVAAATASISKSLGIAENSTPAQIVAACSSLKASGKPDPTKYVDIAAFNDLNGKFAALSSQYQGDQVKKVIDQALEDGKLLPSQVTWATNLGNKDIAELCAYVENAPAIAALTATQTKGNRQDPNNYNLTDADLKVAAATGFTPKEFAKLKEQM